MEIKKAQIGRFDGELKSVGFTEGDTVQTLLDKAGLSLGSGDAVNDEAGESVEVTANAEADATYYIVGNYKQG
jgi:hypothetical protein